MSEDARTKWLASLSEKERIEWEKDRALDHQVMAGEISPENAVELIVARGGTRSAANRRVAILTGQLRHELPDPAKCPDGLYL